MNTKALLFACIAAKVVVNAAGPEDPPTAVNNKDPSTASSNGAEVPTVDINKLPAELWKYHGMEVLWQRIYAHGAGCYRGEITVSWNSDPFHRAQSAGDCFAKCREIVQRDMSNQDARTFSMKGCLAAQRPQFKLTESALVDAPCEGQPMAICQCTGLYNHTNIIKPESELENEWPGGIPYYPKDCEMEKIGGYFANKLPGKIVSAVRKEDNDCPQLRQDHPVIENFERDLGRLTVDQKKQAASEAHKMAERRYDKAMQNLPFNDPRSIKWHQKKQTNRKKQQEKRQRNKFRKHPDEQRQICLDESQKGQEQVKRLNTDHNLGETSQAASNPDNQRMCPIADIENANFPINDLGRFDTLITPSMLEPIAGNDVELTELGPVPNARPLNIDLNEKPEEEDEDNEWAL